MLSKWSQYHPFLDTVVSFTVYFQVIVSIPIELSLQSFTLYDNFASTKYLAWQFESFSLVTIYPLLFSHCLLLLLSLRIQNAIGNQNEWKLKRRKNGALVVLWRDFEIPVWSLRISLSRNEKHQLLRVVAKLVSILPMELINSKGIN